MFSNFKDRFNAVMPMLIYMLLGNFAQAGMIKQESFQDFNRAFIFLNFATNQLIHQYL